MDKKKLNLTKNILLVVFAALLVIINIAYLAQSFYFENDGWGTDMEFDSDYVAALIVSACVLVYAIVNLVRDGKEMNNVFYGSFTVASAVMFAYPLGIFFKGLAKHKEYAGIQGYLYCGLLGLVLLCYMVVRYISDNKKD